MKVRILGAHNTESRSTRLMSLLVDDTVALDAGGLTGSLSFRAQTRIRAVLITHPHYDHLRDLPALAMNFFLRERTFNLYASGAVRDALLTHFLNGKIYPNFLEKPLPDPVIRFNAIEPGAGFQIASFRGRAIPVPHSVPALGYEITSQDGFRLFYTGDTGGGLADCWRQVSPDLLIIEVTMSNRWEQSARENRHMAPVILQEELESFRKVRGYLPRVAAVHMNPGLQPEIETELARVATALGAEIIPAREGMVLQV